MEKSNFTFALALRFELFFALQVLLDPESRVHPAWRARTKAKLPAPFVQSAAHVGGAFLWAVVADTLRDRPVDLSFDQLVETIAALPPDAFAYEIVKGALHDPALTDELLAKKRTLQAAVAKVIKSKREWLAFAGIYPYDAQSPTIQGLERLIEDPAAYRDAVVATLRTFWTHAFAADWDALRPQLQRSLDAHRRLFLSCSLSEFARTALLRIEVDEAAQVIKAMRGGYQLPFAQLESAHLMPSLFNDKRLWTAFETPHGMTRIFVPYFDPQITLDDYAPVQAAEPSLDPALIFRALGDTTRFALASLLAQAPRSSAELAKALGVSKPTVSHHVHLLREAGLLDERPAAAGAVELSLRRSTLENLSALTLETLYHKRRS